MSERSQEELQKIFSDLFSSSPSSFFLVLRDSLHISSGFLNINHIKQYWNLVEKILLVIEAESTYQVTLIVVVLSILHEVEFVVIVPLTNNRQQNTAKHLLFTFQSQNTLYPWRVFPSKNFECICTIWGLEFWNCSRIWTDRRAISVSKFLYTAVS